MFGMNLRTQPTTNASPRAQRVAVAVRAANARRRLRFIIVCSLIVVVLIGWHFLPTWKKYALQSACARIDAYYRAHGHFPASQAELDQALMVGGLFRLGAGVSFD